MVVTNAVLAALHVKIFQEHVKNVKIIIIYWPEFEVFLQNHKIKANLRKILVLTQLIHQSYYHHQITKLIGDMKMLLIQLETKVFVVVETMHLVHQQLLNLIMRLRPEIFIICQDNF